MKNVILIASAIFLASCATQPVYVTVPLDLPPELEVPKVAAEELECLSQPAYDNLETVILLYRQRITTLEDIIKSTHDGE